MPRNGSGVYSLPAGSTVTNGDTSDATDVNTPIQDLATDMNTARPVVAGGTGATSEADARTNLGVVKQTSVTDTTSGSLMINGAFGLGITTAPTEITDIDSTTTPSGAWQFDSGTTNNASLPTALQGANGMMRVERHSSSRLRQTAWLSGGSDTYVRDYTGSWESWEMVYDQSNAVGTVSESSGVTTGALIEVDDGNPPGVTYKFAGGLQICEATVTTSLAINNAFLGGFRSAGQTLSYPGTGNSFASAPTVSVHPVGGTAFSGISQGTPSVSTWNWAVTAVTSQTAADRTVHLLAIGRWYT